MADTGLSRAAGESAIARSEVSQVGSLRYDLRLLAIAWSEDLGERVRHRRDTLEVREDGSAVIVDFHGSESLRPFEQ